MRSRKLKLLFYGLLIINASFIGSGTQRLMQRIAEGESWGWNVFALACSMVAVVVVTMFLEFGRWDT